MGLTLFIDSSVILRRVLGQPGELNEWDAIELAVANPLVEIECLRTIDRLRHRGQLKDEELVAAREITFAMLQSCEILELSNAILKRAGQTLPVPLKTLDAVHLATALTFRELTGSAILMATHDRALARASRAMGLEVVGAA